MNTEANGRERRLVKMVIDGQLDARQLTKYRWRVWLPQNPKLTLDYRTKPGTIVMFRRGEAVKIPGEVGLLFSILRGRSQ